MKKYSETVVLISLLCILFLSACGGSSKNPKKGGSDPAVSGAGEECDIDYADIPDEDFGELSEAAKKQVVQSQKLYKSSGDYMKKKNYDKALTQLDEAYSKLLKIDVEERGGASQQIEDLRFMISKRVMEIYAIRSKGGKMPKNEIPIVLNEHVKKEIRSLTTTERNFFVAALSRSSKYRPMILEKFKDAGIPAELSWLPLIESGFKVNAYSPARALGMWQFIASTGHRYGLNRDEYIDERMDPEKSTDAAIGYLKELHQMFGDWETVLAAYNCGEGRVLRTIRTQDINYLDNFWDLYAKLPNETARYVPRFIATVHIVNNLKDYDMAEVGFDPPTRYETIEVSKRVAIKDIAREAGVSECLLRELNPELRHGVLPPSKYRLKIPAETSEKVLAGISSIQESAPPRVEKEKSSVASSGSSGSDGAHKVARGETLSSIARKYNKSVADLVAVNRINKKSGISPGTMLKIPGNDNAKADTIAKADKTPKNAAKVPSPEKNSDKTMAYTVKKGDTLWTIAKNYATTPDRIIELNKLSGPSVKVGTTIKVDGGSDIKQQSVAERKQSIEEKAEPKDKELKQNSAKAQPKSSQAPYKVKQGDNLFSIARQHNMTVDRILAINRLPKDTKIYPGQTLHIE